jgi:hypothetical protein
MKERIAEMVRDAVGGKQASSLERQLQVLLSLRYRERAERGDPALGFDDVGFDVCSSTGEDGILLYIFSVIGFDKRSCIDIGAGGVEGSNVANLIVQHGFDALLIDGDEPSMKVTKRYYERNAPLSVPTCLSTIITADNVDDTLTAQGFAGTIDLLCLDIDGVDYWIWKAIDAVDPRVVVVEYQDILGPERSWTVPYKPDFNVHDYDVNRDNRNYCGASLRAFTKLAESKGYRLVGCNRGGWNAFYVKRGLADEALPEVTVESCFRYRWNKYGMEKRLPLVEAMRWEEV